MTFDRKAYNREWQRRRRAEQQATAIVTAGSRCPFKLGRVACGGRLVDRVVSGGRVVTACEVCERRKAGRCRECARPVAGVVGRATRCALHAKLAAQAAQERYKNANAARVRRDARNRERARVAAMTPEEYRAHLDRKRAWRLANPNRVLRQKDGERRRNAKANAARARRWREKQPPGYWRTGGPRGPRVCTGPAMAPGSCAVVMTGQRKKCDACKAADRRAARRVLTDHLVAREVAA